LTLEEFLALPERDPPLEYIDGRVVEKPPLVGRENWLRADLAGLLYGWARASRQGAAASGVRCTLGGNSYVPDVVYFAPEHVPATGAEAGPPNFAPDFAVEVCPSAVDPGWVAAKTADYVAHGVRVAWLVDPIEETVTVYRPESAPVMLGRGALLEAEDVLPRFYLHVDDLFDVLAEEEEEHT
jgi:Uma2 family endonuclease